MYIYILRNFNPYYISYSEIQMTMYYKYMYLISLLGI